MPLPPTSDWRQSDFEAFLMLYVAQVDLELAPAEEIFIQQIVSLTRYRELKSYFDQLSDYEVLQTLLGLKGRFIKTETDKEQLVSRMVALLKSDEEFRQTEQNFVMILEKIL